MSREHAMVRLKEADTDTIVLTTRIVAPAVEVWHGLTEADALHAWWDDGVSLEPWVEGRFTERWRDADGREVVTSGRIDVFEPPHLLELTWADADWRGHTRVRIALAEIDATTTLELRHSGWAALGLADLPEVCAAHNTGWRRHLAALKAYAEK